MMAKKALDHEVEGSLIKVYLNGDEYLVFNTENWMFSEYIKFSKAVASEYMTILLNRLTAWNLKDDISGELIAFDKEFIKEHLEVLNIRGGKQTQMIAAYYKAYNVASTLDAEKK